MESPTKPSAKQTFKTHKILGGERWTNDEIHLAICIDPVIQVLMDTPQMQRLRGLKQLGALEYVFNNVNHNRFEHSLGVAHLAERMCCKIRYGQPQLGCTDKDVLCVKIAGLFHDVGHGPFSHTFEEFVRVHLPAYLMDHPDLQAYYDDVSANKKITTSSTAFADLKNWRHESASLMMLDAALEHIGLRIDLHNLDAPLQQIGNGIDATSMRVFGRSCNGTAMTTSSDDDDDDDDEYILTSRDFVFIKEAINGGPVQEICDAVGQRGFVGRPRSSNMEWLYDIVNNRHSGLDVDKIDYFARDQRRAFGKAGKIYKFMIEDAMVAWGDCPHVDCVQCADQFNGKHLMICYPEKLIGKAMKCFRKRFDLHEELYQHETHGAVARMICDIFCMADPHFRVGVRGRDGEVAEKIPISQAMLSARGYVMLRDAVIEQISHDTNPELDPARCLIDRLWSRHLYKHIGNKQIDLGDVVDARLWENLDEKEIISEMLMVQGVDGDGFQLNADDLFVHKVSIHYGLKDRNPLSKMRFVQRSNESKLEFPIAQLPTAIELSTCTASLPQSFVSNLIRIYCRDPDKQMLATHVFEQWREEMKSSGAIPISQNSDEDSDCESNFENENSLSSQLLSPSTVAAVTPQKKRRFQDSIEDE